MSCRVIKKILSKPLQPRALTMILFSVNFTGIALKLKNGDPTFFKLQCILLWGLLLAPYVCIVFLPSRWIIEQLIDWSRVHFCPLWSIAALKFQGNGMYSVFSFDDIRLFLLLLPLGKESPCIFSKFNPRHTDTPLIRKLSMAHSVSVSTGFYRREIKIQRQTWICTTWPSFPLNCRFKTVFSIKIVLDSFYLLIFHSEKFSTLIWRLPLAVNVNLNLSNKLYVNGKRQTSDSSWDFLKIENGQIKTAQNNSDG